MKYKKVKMSVIIDGKRYPCGEVDNFEITEMSNERPTKMMDALESGLVAPGEFMAIPDPEDKSCGTCQFVHGIYKRKPDCDGCRYAVMEKVYK